MNGEMSVLCPKAATKIHVLIHWKQIFKLYSSGWGCWWDSVLPYFLFMEHDKNVGPIHEISESKKPHFSPMDLDQKNIASDVLSMQYFQATTITTMNKMPTKQGKKHKEPT